MSKRIFALGLGLLCGLGIASRVEAQTPRIDLQVYVADNYYTGRDAIAVGQLLFGSRDIDANVWGGETPIEGVVVSYDDDVYLDVWGEDVLASLRHDAIGGKVDIALTQPLPTYENYEVVNVDTFEPSWQRPSEFGLSRAFDKTVLTTDSERIHVTLTLDVPAGALDDYSLWGRLDLGAPEGLSVTLDTTTLVVPAPINNHDDSFGAPGSALNGQYVIEADIDVQRSGTLSQAEYGDMYFKPGVDLALFGDYDRVTATGTQIDAPDAPVSLRIDGPANTQLAADTDDMKWHELETLIGKAGADAEVDQVVLVKMHKKSLTGDDLWQFDVYIEAQNVVEATLTTPTSAAYPMELDYDDGANDLKTDVEFELATRTAAELDAMGFVNGTYTIRLVDHAGRESFLNIELDGGFPSAFPELASQTLGDYDTPTLQWLDPPDDVDALHASLFGVGTPEYDQTIEDGDATSHTFGPTLPLGQQASLAFIDGRVENVDGINYIVGYVNLTDAIVQVTPEPGTLTLLALGAAGLARRRRVRGSKVVEDLQGAKPED